MLFFFSIVLLSRLTPFRVKSSRVSLTLITKLSIISLRWYREEIEMDYMTELAAIAQEHGGMIYIEIKAQILMQSTAA